MAAYAEDYPQNRQMKNTISRYVFDASAYATAFSGIVLRMRLDPLENTPNDPGGAIAPGNEYGGTVVFLRGELDLASAGRLDDELRLVEQLGPDRIVLDCRELEFIDSAGLRVLVDAQRRAERDGRALLLTSVPKQAQRLLSVTGLDAKFTFA
jgi:anti-sigma B factor antagonist